MSIPYFILMGLVIGVVARLVLPGRQRIGILLTMLIGAVGALIGGVVASAVATGRVGNMNLLGFIVAVVASVALVAATEAAGIGGDKRRLDHGRGDEIGR